MKIFQGKNKFIVPIVIFIVILTIFYLVFADNENQSKNDLEFPEERMNNEQVDNDQPTENGQATEETEENEREEESNGQSVKKDPPLEKEENGKKEVVKEPAKTEDSFVQCLVDAGVVVYGTRTCPACAQLVESFGGYQVIDPIFIDCNQNWDKCMEKMQTSYVPEIQINGVLFNGPRTPQALAEETGCQIDQ